MTRGERYDRFEERTAEIARALKAVLDREHDGPVGFCLLLFDYGEEGSFSYAATAARKDVTELLEEALIKIRAAERLAAGGS